MSTTRTTSLLAGVAATVALAVAGEANATITYAVDQIIGAGSVVGDIVTDGATGVIGASDIVGWNLQLNGVGATYTLTNGNSGVFVGGADTTATPTHIYYNFSASDFGYLLFEVNFGSGSQYWCNNADADSLCFQGATVVPVFFSDPSTQNAPMSGTQIIGTAGAAVPEPAAWALMLLGVAGVGLSLRARRFRLA
jgi:hypothetical protein